MLMHKKDNYFPFFLISLKMLDLAVVNSGWHHLRNVFNGVTQHASEPFCEYTD